MNTTTSPGPPRDRQRVAVIILTFNEEPNLAEALSSVEGWSDEIVVVDSFSTDRTVDIALERKGVAVYQHRFENYSSQWNWALRSVPLRSGWTLKLDADERVPGDFRDEVEEVLRTCPPDLEGMYFRRHFFFMGKRLRWGGIRGNFDLRLWRTGAARFEGRAVNEHAIVSGRTVRLQSAIEHRDARSLGDWLRKHERYASLEAAEILSGNLAGEVRPRFLGRPEEMRVALRRLFYRLPGRSGAYFLYRVALRLGILDGRIGLRYWFLHASFFAWISWMLQEARATGTVPEVIWPARGSPHPRAIQG